MHPSRPHPSLTPIPVRILATPSAAPHLTSPHLASPSPCLHVRRVIYHSVLVYIPCSIWGNALYLEIPGELCVCVLFFARPLFTLVSRRGGG